MAQGFQPRCAIAVKMDVRQASLQTSSASCPVLHFAFFNLLFLGHLTFFLKSYNPKILQSYSPTVLQSSSPTVQLPSLPLHLLCKYLQAIAVDPVVANFRNAVTRSYHGPHAGLDIGHDLVVLRIEDVLEIHNGIMRIQ